MSMTPSPSSVPTLTSKGQSDSRGGYFSVNVGHAERQASVVAGGVLTVLGLSRKSVAGVAVAAVGAGFLYRGLSGHCGIYKSLGLNTAAGETGQTHRPRRLPEARRARRRHLQHQQTPR